MFKQSHSNVPIELIQFAHKHKMHRALGLYLLMRTSCDGNMVLTAGCKMGFKELLRIKDDRSFNKHLQKLLDENWIGHDKVNQVYYIRGIKALRSHYGFYEVSAVAFDIVRDAPHITSFIHGAIIGQQLKKRNRARNGRIIKLAGSSALKKESAIQELAASGKISAYIGLSVSIIGKMLEVSQSQADRIKTKLIDLGYMSARQKFNVVHEADKPDFSLIKYLPSSRRYSVKRKTKNKKVVYVFSERCYDELFSLMEFKNQKSVVKRMGNFGIYGFGKGVKGVTVK